MITQRFLNAFPHYFAYQYFFKILILMKQQAHTPEHNVFVRKEYSIDDNNLNNNNQNTVFEDNISST